MGGPTVDVNHPHLRHAVGGRRWGLRAQGGQLAVARLLPVQRRVVHGVGGAGPAVGAGGADGGAVEAGANAVLGTLHPGAGDAHASLLQEVGVGVQALVGPAQAVALAAAHVLVGLDIPPLQDGTGAGRVGAGGGVGAGHPLPGHGGATSR